MKTRSTFLFLLSSSAFVQSHVYLNEKFDGEWQNRWVESEARPVSERGIWEQTPGNWFADENDLALKTSSDARFYMLSRKIDQPFHNEGKDLVIQYVVKNEQDIDCGGAYVKLMGSDLDQANFQGDSSYKIMFGPDICGSSKKTHAILNFQRPIGDTEVKNMDHKGQLAVRSDVHAHLYTFVLKKDNTYQFKIDGEEEKAGKLSEGWPFQPEKEIKDPAQSKPSEWVDAATIPDPEDYKPQGYDDIPKMIPDSEATMPEDWDEEDDGEWEAPMIDNPEYKGEWEPRMIPNPEYKGEWKHPMIANPDFFEDDKMYVRCDPCEYVGFELWQVKSGTVFDDLYISDDIEEALAHETQVLKKLEALKAAKEKQDEEAEKAREAEEPAEEETVQETQEDDEDEEDDEDDITIDRDEL